MRGRERVGEKGEYYVCGLHMDCIVALMPLSFLPFGKNAQNICRSLPDIVNMFMNSIPLA